MKKRYVVLGALLLLSSLVCSLPLAHAVTPVEIRLVLVPGEPLPLARQSVGPRAVPAVARSTEMGTGNGLNVVIAFEPSQKQPAAVEPLFDAMVPLNAPDSVPVSVEGLPVECGSPGPREPAKPLVIIISAPADAAGQLTIHYTPSDPPVWGRIAGPRAFPVVRQAAP